MTANVSNAGADSPTTKRGPVQSIRVGATTARRFDPHLSLDLHQILAEVVTDTGEMIELPTVWTPALRTDEQEHGIWRCVLTSDELARDLKQMREVGKLPLSGLYAEAVQTHLGELELALEVRLRGAVVRHRTSTGGRL